MSLLHERALEDTKQTEKRLCVCLRFFCIFEYKCKGHIGRPKVQYLMRVLGLATMTNCCGFECTILYMTTQLGFHISFRLVATLTWVYFKILKLWSMSVCILSSYSNVGGGKCSNSIEMFTLILTFIMLCKVWYVWSNCLFIIIS